MKYFILLNIIAGLVIILSCNYNQDNKVDEDVYSDENIYNEVILSLLDSNRYFFINRNLPEDSIHFVHTLPLDSKLVLNDSLINLSDESILSYVNIENECKELVPKKIDIKKLKIPKPYIKINREDCMSKDECVMLTLSRICINTDTQSGFFIAFLYKKGDVGRGYKIQIKKSGDNWIISEMITIRIL